MRRCFVFPGQGAQYVGMGRDIHDAHPQARRLFDAASDLSGFDVAGLVFSGTEEQIKATDRSQVAITTVNLAARRVLRLRGVEAAETAGFSLGEFAALVEAGILSEADALALVIQRGRIMEEVSRSLDSAAGPPGMAAVIGLGAAAVAAALEGVTDVYPANLNAPQQTVLSGTAPALERAAALLKAAGAKRVITLKVSGPFHSPLMAEAKERFAEVLRGVRFSDPVKPVYSNVTGSRIGSGAEARSLCAEQLVRPVRWVDEEASIAAGDCDEVLEVGPGEVLCGLWRAWVKEHPDSRASCRPAGTAEQILAIDP